MDNIAAYIKDRHFIYSTGVVGHFEKIFRKSGYSLGALTRELEGIDFNLPPSRNSINEKAKLLLEMIEAPSHNISTEPLMDIAASFAAFVIGAAAGGTIAGFVANLNLIFCLAIFLVIYVFVTGWRSGVRQRLVQALHVLAEAGEVDE